MTFAFFAASALFAIAPALAQQSPQTPTDAIHHILDAQTDAWNRNDADAWAADFLDDATFINVRGDLVTGRQGIAKLHSFIFAGPYHGSHCALTVDHVTFPSPAIAVVLTTAEVTGFRGLPPGVVATAPGVLRTRFTFIFVQQHGAWKMSSAQNTPVAPQAMPVQ